jgi:hypothetical protein
MNQEQFLELLLQALEHEQGGVKIYQTALTCAINGDLAGEWKKYLKETQEHEKILTEMCLVMGMDPEQETLGRLVVRHSGEALVAAMERTLKEGKKEQAQVVACECVVLAETKDHLNWELLGKCAAKLPADQKKALEAAVEKVEDQEDEHLYHTKGWCRELWIEALGMKAILPPPEEEKHVKTAIGAARAEQSAPHTR